MPRFQGAAPKAATRPRARLGSESRSSVTGPLYSSFAGPSRGDPVPGEGRGSWIFQARTGEREASPTMLFWQASRGTEWGRTAARSGDDGERYQAHEIARCRRLNRPSARRPRLLGGRFFAGGYAVASARPGFAGSSCCGDHNILNCRKETGGAPSRGNSSRQLFRIRPVRGATAGSFPASAGERKNRAKTNPNAETIRCRGGTEAHPCRFPVVSGLSPQTRGPGPRFQHSNPRCRGKP